MVRTSLELGSVYGTKDRYAYFMGLKDKIKMASSEAIVESLLAEGQKFNSASPKTRRHWQATASRRLKELRIQTEKKTVAQRSDDAPEAKKTFKRKV
jgi:hypothetical protein